MKQQTKMHSAPPLSTCRRKGGDGSRACGKVAAFAFVYGAVIKEWWGTKGAFTCKP